MKKSKFIVINTWNGFGYSYLNGDDSKIFESHEEAIKYAEKLFKAYTSDFEYMKPITINEDFKYLLLLKILNVSKLRPILTMLHY